MSLVLRYFFLIVTLFVIKQTDTCFSDYSFNLRQDSNINNDWFYLENNTPDVVEAQNMVGWKGISLPHTWNQWDAVDMNPGYRRDASWYKKKILIDKEEDVLYKLYFEGSNITTSVYVNDKLATSHVGGYVGFEVDVTDLINDGIENVIMVRVDNSYNPQVIPSQKADFVIYGGITRDVWLRTVPKVNIQKVLISAPEVSSETALTHASIQLENISNCESCSINAKILDPETDKQLAQINLPLSKDKSRYDFNLPSINNPKLWGPNSPSLYTIVFDLKSEGEIIDRREEKMGYRWYSFKDNGPFFLNGERLLLRGTHRHEEHAGLGAAMSNELHRKDIQMIKDLGVNFLRLGHYPQDPEIYKACDELGIIVWDELPWCRGGIGDSVWKKNTMNLLEEQIIQNYNHPSIFFWSLGNEIYWLPDFEDGGNTGHINEFLVKMNKKAHDLDQNRMTAIRKYYDGSDLVDVFSPSIWSGWYAGVYTNYKPTLEKNQDKYKRFLHMEYGGSSHVGRHTENPITGSGTLSEDDWEEVSNQVDIKNIAKDGDWTENYIVDLFDWYLSVSEQMDDFAGNAQWAFKDFATPLRPENAIPYINQKGLVDREGNPKDAYYVFKSYWTKEPMVYIESHTWKERQGPKGKSREVSVFSNTDKVELIHNGKSQGFKSRDMSQFPACGLNWNIQFSDGLNSLIAIAHKDNVVAVSDTLIVNYSYEKAGTADHIDLSYSKLANGNLMILAEMKDKKNLSVLDYEGRIYFTLDGSGQLLMNYGTPSRSQVVEMANGKARIEMVPGKGVANIEARNQDFKGSYLIINPSNESKLTSSVNQK